MPAQKCGHPGKIPCYTLDLNHSDRTMTHMPKNETQEHTNNYSILNTYKVIKNYEQAITNQKAKAKYTKLTISKHSPH